MGWFGSNMSRKELIADLTAVSAHDDEHSRVTIKHCYRGNAYSGILWSVVEAKLVITKAFNLSVAGEVATRRYIHCDLMQYRGGMWWHKPMVEASHPLYYSCPKKYLQLVPDDAPNTCAEWRAKVREYHEIAAQRRLKKTQLAAKY